MRLSQFQVKHLHEDGEGHRKIDVAFRDVLVKAFGDQRHADEQQKTERQHLDCGTALDEVADGACEHHHKHYRNHNSRDHDLDLVHHTDGRNHRIKGENDVKQKYLHDDTHK